VTPATRGGRVEVSGGAFKQRSVYTILEIVYTEPSAARADSRRIVTAGCLYTCPSLLQLLLLLLRLLQRLSQLADSTRVFILQFCCKYIILISSRKYTGVEAMDGADCSTYCGMHESCLVAAVAAVACVYARDAVGRVLVEDGLARMLQPQVSVYVLLY
jgi:hypothetical protein